MFSFVPQAAGAEAFCTKENICEFGSRLLAQMQLVPAEMKSDVCNCELCKWGTVWHAPGNLEVLHCVLVVNGGIIKRARIKSTQESHI